MSENIARNNQLYPAVLAGTAAAREAMILNNLGLVVVKADSLIRQTPQIAYLRDDLVSAGNIGLVQAVYQIKRHCVQQRAVNSWLGRGIVIQMQRLRTREHTIYIPQTSAERARRKGRPITPPSILNGLSEKLESYLEFETVDLRDLMDASCQSGIERECLRLREAGCTFKEISRTLRIPLPTANYLFRRLKVRVLARWQDSARAEDTVHWQMMF